jgi:hypothetical protein
MRFFENTRKPQGFGGKLMTKMINGMKIYTSKQLVAALKEAGFTEIKTYSNAKNHWISIVATK